MAEPSFPEFAIARWLAQGATSLTHPLLRNALETCFYPLGIEADWLEAEPFGAGENSMGLCWLRRPRWNPIRLSSKHPAAADLGPWAADPSAVTVDASGIFCLRAPLDGEEPARDSDRSWRAIRHSVRSAQRAAGFIHAAAGLLLAGDPIGRRYAAGDDSGFSAEIWRRLDDTAPGPKASIEPVAPETNLPGGAR